MDDRNKIDQLKSSRLSVQVLSVLKGIPQDLLDLFTPKDSKDIVRLEVRAAKLRDREEERNKVMKLQRNSGLKIQPNMSAIRCMVFVRLKTLKDRKNQGGT